MSEVLYKYIGNGAFVVDVPARDILASETEHHMLVEANLNNSSLPCWVKVEKPKAKPATSAKESE